MRKMWLCALGATLALTSCGGDETGSTDNSGGGTAAVSEGEQLFLDNCAQCHGADLKGTTAGPPFLDEIYEPGHHPDEAFYSAAANGVQAHHWEFGDMAPVPGVTEEEVAKIIGYVREQQRAAGIE